MNNKPYNVCISYSKADGEEFAKRLHARLLKDEKGRQLKYWKSKRCLEDATEWNKTAYAVKYSECLVLVFSPDSIASEHIQMVLRQPRIDEVRVFIVKLPGMEVAHDLLPPQAQRFHMYDTEREWESFVQELYQHCQLGKLLNMAPALPAKFVHRPQLHEQVKQQLLLSNEQKGVPLYLSITGAEGYGKTTLACALCHDREIQEYYDDGVLWMSLNTEGNALEEATKVYNTATGDNRVFSSLDEATKVLSDVLYQMDTSFLLVIDHVQWFHQLSLFMDPSFSKVKILSIGPGSVEVRTSRNGYKGEEAVAFGVGEMEEEEAFLLLTKGWKPEPAASALVGELVTASGKCPLLLGLLNRAALTQAKTDRITLEVLNKLYAKLRQPRRERRDEQSNEGVSNLEAGIIEAILGLLPSEQKLRSADMGIFPANTPIPSETVYALWNVEPSEGKKILRQLDELALVHFVEASASVTLHSVLRAYFKSALERSDVQKARLVQNTFPETAICSML